MKNIIRLLCVFYILTSSQVLYAGDRKIISGEIALDQFLFNTERYFDQYLDVHGYLIDISLGPDTAIYALVRSDDYAGFQRMATTRFRAELEFDPEFVEHGTRIPSMDACLNHYVSVLGTTGEHALKGGLLALKDVQGVFIIEKDNTSPVCWLPSNSDDSSE